MQDLKTARTRLKEKSLTLSIVKDGNILFETSANGVSGFLTAIEKCGEKLVGASVADKIAGKAIALLCVYAKIEAVYAVVLSKEAKAVLDRHAIYHEFDELVENILDSKRRGVCPFEKSVMDVSDSKKAYNRLRALQKALGCSEREQFISEDAELKRIREAKLKTLSENRERMQKMSMKPAHVTDSNFNEIVNKHQLALIDCWASWCGPCLALAPTIEELAKEYSGKVFIGKLDVDENPQTAECFQIFSIPTVLIMKNGKEAERIVGLVPKKHIEAALKKHLG